MISHGYEVFCGITDFVIAGILVAGAVQLPEAAKVILPGAGVFVLFGTWSVRAACGGRDEDTSRSANEMFSIKQTQSNRD